MVNKKEIQRYNRQIILPDLGQEGQEKLKQARVLIVGAGGLGCPVLQYLAAAGVGTLGIVDGDQVDISNLHRQVLYTEEDVGQPKARIAAERLRQLNPHNQYIVHETHLSNDNALAILQDYNIIVDGTDNFPTRYRVNDACVMLDKPLVAASIFLFEGQLSVFNYQGGATYRCLYPEPPAPESVPSCAEIGVLGIIPGILGTWQANEVIKMITGIGEVLRNKLLIFDARNYQSRQLNFELNPENLQIQQLTDYEEFCEGPQVDQKQQNGIPSVTVQELQQWLQQNPDLQLIDVREPHEYEICHFEQARLIPMNSIDQHVKDINPNQKTVVHCHHGMRSAQVIKHLQENHQLNNLYNLEGGIDAWSREIDPDMPRY